MATKPVPVEEFTPHELSLVYQVEALPPVL
jgi:hypothetical protein